MATIKDIAKASQVCPATVSNVLNNSRPVHPRTRERVLEAARLAQYRPNAIARGLVGKRMNTIGVVYLHHDADANLDPYFVAMLDGILAQARRRHQNVTLCTSGSWNDDTFLLPNLCDGRCDGILLIVPPREDIIAPGLQAAGVPFVIIGSPSDDPTIPTVDIDNVAGAASVVQHLIDQKHRRIALLTLGADLQFSYVSERTEGYRRALESNGIPFDPSLILGLEGVRPALETMMALPKPQRPTALFCVIDLVALEAMQSLQEMGVHIPDDISIAGFDDIAAAAISRPPLTTVRQPFREIGDHAVERLMALIEKKSDDARSDLLPTELILRSSVAPPAPS